jgi:hypothetical protein
MNCAIILTIFYLNVQGSSSCYFSYDRGYLKLEIGELNPPLIDPNRKCYHNFLITLNKYCN